MSVRTVGIDLAKQVFQVHGVDDAGRPVLKKRLRRAELRAFFAGLSPCLIRPDGRPTVKEVGDFVAHHAERERGIITDATRDWISIVLFHCKGGVIGPSRLLYANALPSDTIEYLKAMLDRFDSDFTRTNLGMKQKDARKELNKIIEQLKRNSDGTFWFSPRNDKQTKLFNLICTTIITKPAFDGDRLADDLLAILRSAGAITQDEARQAKHLHSLFQVFAISAMHNSRIVAKTQGPIILKAAGAPELSVYAAILTGKSPSGADIGLSSPIFHTSLKAANCCEPELLADGEWSGDIEVTPNGRLGYLT